MAAQRVLIADDEETIRYVFSGILKHEGLDVITAADGAEAVKLFDENQPDLVILDVMMPLLNGFQVCERIKSDPDHKLTPVIIVTASSASENRIRGLESGADDFLSKPVDRIELVARVRSLLRIKGYTAELERAETVLMALAKSIEGKDPYTQGHCERLSVYAQVVGRRLALPDDELTALRRAGVVHDIGKVAVPESILLKPARLTPEEMDVVKQHPVVGERICCGLKSFKKVLPIIRHHHEKLDGTGYPDGLRGEAIPFTARVLQIVDVFDALTTARPYKPAFAIDKALDIMAEEVEKGWWDPDIFPCFVDVVREKGFELQGDTETSDGQEQTVGDMVSAGS